MVRRFTRRKPRVVWLPVYGDNAYGESGGIQSSIGIRFSAPQTLPATGITVDAVGITWDGGSSVSAAQGFGSSDHSLADFTQGSSYRLRRIVGKFWCDLWSANVGNVTCAKVGFGFIVGRADPNGALQTDFQQVNPLFQDSADDPWIWRRTWLLSPSGYGNNAPFGRFPQTNVAYGSVADGPHIDAKTARVIGPDERLVAVMASQIVQTSDDQVPTQSIQLNGYLDYRILASMRQNLGNRRNASR